MGGKNQNTAESSGNEMSGKGSSQAPKKDNKAQGCKKTPKHWIGVRVEDEDGKLVKDVTVHAKLDDEFDVDMATAAVGKDGVYKTKKIFDPGECEFSFPAVYDVDWWPQGGTKPTAFPAEQSVNIEDGGCVVSAAAAAGFRDYHALWDCAANTDVKNACPNPNQQTTGGTYQGPNKKTKTEKKALDQAWTFVIRNRKPPKLRIVLFDKEDKPLQNKSWECTKLAAKGKTGPDGMIEVTSAKLLKLTAEKLKVTLKAAVTPPKVVKPPKTKPPEVAPYPPPIVAADFKDKLPDPDYTAQVVQWDLKIGSLTAFSVHAGALQRLQNLGFTCEADPGVNPTAEGEPEAIQAYVRLYQKKDATTETWDDIKQDLRDRHDKA
jgi:hypothetical protein